MQVLIMEHNFPPETSGSVDTKKNQLIANTKGRHVSIASFVFVFPESIVMHILHNKRNNQAALPSFHFILFFLVLQIHT